MSRRFGLSGLPNRLGQKGGGAPPGGLFAGWLSGELLLGQGALFAIQFCKGEGNQLHFSAERFSCSIFCPFISLCVNVCAHTRNRRAPTHRLPVADCLQKSSLHLLAQSFSHLSEDSHLLPVLTKTGNNISGSPIDKHGKPETVSVGNCPCPVLPR